MSDEELDMEKIKELVADSELPADLKEKLIADLPRLLDSVGEAASTVYDPSKIWLEAIQFADYVQQHTEHLAQKHSPECEEESLETLMLMTESFKQMAENAMRVLDTLKIETELIDWDKIKITYGKDKDAQS
jgi:hypothetical protein